MQRPCLRCGRLIERGSYCPGCKPARLRGRAGVELRERVKRRDLVCVECSCPHTLEIHHVNGDPTDNRMENLVALCRSCHAKVSQRG
jgi:5-methylcytosine-specific restriction endonuclease McrA